MIGFYLSRSGKYRKLVVRKTTTGASWTIPKDWAKDTNGLFGISLPLRKWRIGSLKDKRKGW